MTATKTVDTGAHINQAGLPEHDYSGDGYDYISTAAARGWHVLASWGRDGYDFGAWPYIIGFVRNGRDQGMTVYGFGTYIEGDLRTKWFATPAARNEAISREAHWYWREGQSDGPEGLPERFEDVAEEYRVPYDPRADAPTA